MKTTTWLALIFAALVVGAIVLSTFRSQPFHCTVCITFKGRTDCRSASAQSREQAQRAATTTACSQLAGGVTDTMQCENTAPDSVNWQ